MKKLDLTLASRSLLTLLLLCTCAIAGEDAPKLLHVKHAVVSPTTEQVILQFNGSYSPKIFTLKDEKPRIVLDFSEMGVGGGVQPVASGKGPLVKRIRTGVHSGDGAKTRVVLDLATLKGVNYSQHFDDKTSSLVLEITAPKSVMAGLQKPAPAKAAAAPAKSTENEAAPNSPEASSPQATTSSESAPPAQSTPAAKEESTAAKAPVPQAPVTVQAPQAQPPSPPAKAETTTAKPAPPAPKEETAPVKPAPVTPQLAATAQAPQAQPSSPPAKAETTTAKPATTSAAQPPATAAAPVKPAENKAPSPAPTGDKNPAVDGSKAVVAEKNAPPQEATQAPPGAAPTQVKAGEAGQPAANGPAPVKETPSPSRAEAAKPAPTKADTAMENSQQTAQLEDVRFEGSSPKGEMVLFKLNGFHPPAVHGAEEGIPRVICDFNNTKLTGSPKNLIKTTGKFVKVIRTTKSKKPEKVRVVIDLEPNHSYDLQQVFFKDDNLFVIIVNTVKN